MDRSETQRKSSAKYYAANKADVIARKKAHRNSLAEYVRELRANTPCMDCGVNHPWYVMEFDHRDGAESKEHRIPYLVNRGSRKRLLEEIAKCDLVCANCHSVRTHMRRVALPQLVEGAS